MFIGASLIPMFTIITLGPYPNPAVGHLCHVVDVCSKLQKISMTIGLSVSDQLIASDWKTTKIEILRYSMTIKQ